MAKLSDHLILLDGAIEPDLQSAPVGGGVMIAYTCRSPDKETENEDTVAIIPWGPQAAVLVVADGAGGLPAGKRELLRTRICRGSHTTLSGSALCRSL